VTKCVISDKIEHELTCQRLLKSMIGQWTARVVAVKSLELDVIEKRDGAILQYVILPRESPQADNTETPWPDGRLRRDAYTSSRGSCIASKTSN
jgi:hypothetical protein